jgi:hypothetical protein
MIIPENVETYLQRIRIPLRLSCLTKTGWPASLSLWYLYRDGEFYCATQASARVVKYLNRDQRCAFEVSSDQPPYCGVRGQATARIDRSLGPGILKSLLTRYLGSTENPLARDLLKKSSTEVASILTPRNLFSWDFTERMRGSIQSQSPHNCP